MATAASAAAAGPPLINLMPRAEIERRARVSLVRRWAWGVVAALVVVGLASAGALTLRLGAEIRLAAENLRTTSLLGELSDLSDVRGTLALEGELTDFRSQAMASDLDWPAFVTRVRDAAPEGVGIVGWELTPGAIPVGDDAALEIGAIGTFTFESGAPVDMVPLIRAVRPLPGVMEADGWEVTSEGETGARKYTYLLHITVDQSLYTDAYRTEDPE